MTNNNKYKRRKNNNNIVCRELKTQNWILKICDEHFDQQKKTFSKNETNSSNSSFLWTKLIVFVKICFEKIKTKNFKSFMWTIVAKKFKIWLLWTLNAYFDVKVIFSLNNYWRILKMIMFNVVDRKLKTNFAKNVNNVRYISSLFTNIRSNWFVRFV